MAEKSQLRSKKPLKPLNVFMHHGEHSAVGFYRIIQPSRSIAKQKLACIVNIEFQPQAKNPISEVPTNKLEDIVKWSDVLLFSRFDNPNALAVVKTIRETYHVPILMELDDLPMEINDDSHAFHQYRMDKIMNNADAAYWSVEQMKLSDGIFTTNRYLKERIEKIIGKLRKVHIVPNCIDVNQFAEKESRPDEIINIGWAGGSNHQNDLLSIKPIILRILKEYDHVRFITFGYRPEWTKKTRHCIHHNWVTFDKYYKKLESLKLDIGIAPLIDNEFNRCKSNLRWLEYSAMGIPTVASWVIPFQVIQTNETGYLARNENEWYAQLRALIERPKVRKRIGNNAKRYVARYHNPDRWAKYYVQIFGFYYSKYARSAKRIFGKDRNRYTVDALQ